MSAMDNLTCCITAFRRPERLAKAVESAQAAGFTKIVVCDGEEYGHDIGCNNTWMVAAYRATTKRILVLHDDDTLDPLFGDAYETIIAPCLDKRDAGFASWNASLKYDDGRTEPYAYWQGASSVMPSRRLLAVAQLKGSMTLSPNVSVFNRAVLIRACKEAGEKLILSDSLERPGMLLGTELLVYIRHCQTFTRWLHVDKVLSYLHCYPGSGTIKAQEENREGDLVKGYDLARDLGLCPPAEPTPRIILAHSVYKPKDPVIVEKQRKAQESWKWHFSNADFIDLPLRFDKMPTVRMVLDRACEFALPEDIILYANEDAGLTTHAYERIVEGVARGRGVTCLGNRALVPEPGRLYKSITNCKAPGGIDMVACTPAWWQAHREKMPDMFIGREAWDSVFATLAEEWVDGRGAEDVSKSDYWRRSRAHTDNVCWHEPHHSEWVERILEPGGTQAKNRELAREFFTAHGNLRALDLLK